MSQMFNVFTMAQQFRTNPVGMLAQRYNLPQGVNDPQQIIQHLLNTGQITQNDVNMAMQMRNSPMFKGLF